MRLLSGVRIWQLLRAVRRPLIALLALGLALYVAGSDLRADGWRAFAMLALHTMLGMMTYAGVIYGLWVAHGSPAGVESGAVAMLARLWRRLRPGITATAQGPAAG